MTKLFLQVLNMSITSCYVILFVVVARLLLVKAPRVYSYSLWSVVLFRLCCPFSFESIWSLLPRGQQTIPPDIVYATTPQIESGIVAIDSAVNAVLPAATPTASVNPLQLYVAVGGFVWVTVSACMVLYSVASALRLAAKLRTATHLTDNLYLTTAFASPFVFGIFHPRIYLPGGLTDSERDYIVRHEQVHIKRLDHLIKPLAYLLLCVHWFNPLVWVAFVMSARDMELSCDERVIGELGSDIKQNYSASLLALSTGRRMVGGCPLAFGENDVGARIKNVLRYKKPTLWIAAIAAVAVVAVGIALVANPPNLKNSMKWAQRLRVEDVQKIEATVSPLSPHYAYINYEPSQFGSIVELINGANGNYLLEPEDVAGGGITYYVTTTDGRRHMVSNNGNTYLVIDGDSYKASYMWLSNWDSPGNLGPMPLDFWEEDAPAAPNNALTDEQYYELGADGGAG